MYNRAMNREAANRSPDYSAYRTFRSECPEIPVSDYVAAFGGIAVKEMEKDFQQEMLEEVYSDDSIPHNVEGEDQDPVTYQKKEDAHL